MLLAIVHDLPGQACPNLICNGDFENFISMPSCGGPGNANLADFSINKAQCWQNANPLTTSDPYEFSADYLSPLVSYFGCLGFTPSPHSGSFHAGMAFGRNGVPLYREYVVNTSPVTPVVTGRWYRVRYHYRKAVGPTSVPVRPFISNSQADALDNTGALPPYIFDVPSTNGYTEASAYFQPPSAPNVYLFFSFHPLTYSEDLHYYYLDNATVTEALGITTTGSNTVCQGQTANFSVTALSGTGFTWTVSPPEPFTLSAGGATCNIPVFNTPGLHTITVTGTTPGGCLSTEHVVVTVSPSPSASISLTGSNPTCITSPPTLTFSGSAGTLQWFFNGTPIPGATGTSFTPTQTGSYYAVVTSTISPNCATSSNIINVVVGQPPNVTISGRDESCDLANDGTAFASVTGGTAGYTYLWNTVPPQTTNSLTGLNAGTYTVTVTDAAGCVSTASVTIGTGPLPPSPQLINSLPGSSLCNSNGIVYYTILNYDSHLNYSFSPLSPMPVSPGVYMVNWGSTCNNVIFSVSVHSGNPLCTVTATDTLFACCPCAASAADVVMTGAETSDDVIDLYNTYSASGVITVSGSTYTYSNPTGVLYLNQVFTVPTGVTFQIVNSEVRMGGGASITLGTSGSSVLTINNSWIHAGCNSMWDGIYEYPGDQVTVFNGTQVEDAMNAIVSVGGAPFSISSSIFNKNRIGVWAKPVSGNHPGAISNTVFTCRNITGHTTILALKGLSAPGAPACQYDAFPVGSLPAGGMLFPLTGERSKTGLLAENVGLSVVNPITQNLSSYTEMVVGQGSAFSQLNIFDYLDFGIYASNSNLTVRNNHFEFITGPSAVPKGGILTGIAIYGKANAQTGYCRMMVGSTVRNSFYNCGRGVDLNDYYAVTVNNNCFKSTQVYSNPLSTAMSPVGNQAITVTTPAYFSVTASGNNINNWANGITFNAYALQTSSTSYYRVQGDANFNQNFISPTGGYTLPVTQFVAQAIHAAYTIPTCTACTFTGSVFGSTRAEGNNIINVFNGIQFRNWRAGTPRIHNNAITMVMQANAGPIVYAQHGIRVINSRFITVQLNNITGPSTAKRTLRGIYHTNATGTVQCNTIFTTGQSMTFEGACASVVRNNNMNTAQEGLVLMNAGVIGQQGLSAASSPPNGVAHDNLWIGSFSTGQTVVDATSNALSSALYVRPGVTTQPTSNAGPPGQNYNTPGAIVLLSSSAATFNCSGLDERPVQTDGSTAEAGQADLFKSSPPGAEDGQEAEVKIHPNPSSGLFMAQIACDAEVVVRDVQGRQVNTTINHTAQGQMEIDISSEPDGIYLVTFTCADHVFVKKLVKN